MKDEIECPRTTGQLQMYYIHVMRIPGKKRKGERHRSNMRISNDGEFSQVNIGHTATDTGISDNTLRINTKRKSIPYLIIFELQKSKDENSL